MPSAGTDQHGMAWLAFALISVTAWGLYGVLLHTGQVSMADSLHGRYKAFLWVGVAYFFAAVLAPVVALWISNASWRMPPAGITWSLLAGLAGAVGAFCVLLAFGAKGSPVVVMSIIFAGAPIVNAVVVMAVHRPAGGWLDIRWPFVVGIVLAALGGCLVTLYRPLPSSNQTPSAVAIEANRQTS